MINDNIGLTIKSITLFASIFGLVFATGSISFGDAFASGNDKIDICYKDKDKKIKEKDLNKWLAKGSTEGKCHDDDDDDDNKGHGKGNFKHVLRGEGPPPEKLGKIGDLYFDTNNDPNSCMDFYVKIAKHQWEQRGTLCDNDEDLDQDPTNELQDLSLTGQDLSLTPAGNTANLPFVFDDFSCPDGEVVVGFNNDGTTICATGGGSSGANEQLSNLDVGNVAVNTNVIPDTDVTHDLGSDVLRWLTGFFNNLDISGDVDIGGDVDISGLASINDLFFDFFEGENCSDTSGCFPGSYLQEASVDNSKIEPNTLGSGQIASDAIGTSELADNAVDTNSIQDGSVTTAKLATGAVSLNVVRDVTGLTLIAAGESENITIECADSSDQLTGFTVLDQSESGLMVVKQMVDNGSDPTSATMEIINLDEDNGILVSVVFYCASISP